jgi:lauroyl/myristoyl acyltransferase
MKEEGFVNGALNRLQKSGMTARFLANQTCFMASDSTYLPATTKAAIIVAIAIYNEDYKDHDLTSFLSQAVQAETVGQFKSIIAAVQNALKQQCE